MRLKMDESSLALPVPSAKHKRSLTPTRQQKHHRTPTNSRPTTPTKKATSPSPRSTSPLKKNAKSRSRPSSPSPKKNSTSSSRPSSPSKKTSISTHHSAHSSHSSTPPKQIPHPLPMQSTKLPTATASSSHNYRRRLSLDTVSSWTTSYSSSTSSISSSTSPSLILSPTGLKRASAPVPQFFIPNSPSCNSLVELGNSTGRRSSDVALESNDKDDDEDKMLQRMRASRRRASQADIMLRASQVDLLMHKAEKKNTLPILKAKHKSSKTVNGRKECYVLVDLDEDETVVLTCRDEQHLKSILTAALMDRRVNSYRLVVASTRAVFKVDQGISRRVRSCEDLLESTDFGSLDDLGREDDINDERFHLTREFIEQERYYCDKLQSLFEFYAEPLRKFSSLSKEDHQVMFVPIEPLFSISASLLAKLETVLDSWDTDTSRLGNLFSTKFWNYYQEYLSTYPNAKRLLTEKYRTDPAFEEFCELRQNQGRLSLDALLSLPVKRVPDFDRYLAALLEETDPSHHDYEDIARAAKRVHLMVKEKEDDLYEIENQAAMDSVQERFPQDDLHLTEPFQHSRNNSDVNDNISSNTNNSNNSSNSNSIENESIGHISYNKNKNENHSEISENMDKIGSKTKRLSLRRRSAPSAVLFKTISGNRSKSTTSLWSNAGMGKRDSDNVINSQAIRIDADTSRMFLMEGSVQLATGMQIQERYMFLFNDLLLLAKQKSSTTYKLKHRIQLCDMWIASCIDEVCEITRPTERSFVIGWPTTNAAVTFPTIEEKDKWLRTLVDGITKEKLKDEGTTLQLKVSPRDIQSSNKTACQMTINNETKADDVLVQCLKQMSIADTDAADYQLWVSSGKEGTAYPLIGHETPFSIKRNQLREVTRSKSRDDINTMTSGDFHSSILDAGTASKEKCDFYINPKKGKKKSNIDDPSFQKKSKFKSPNIFSKLASKISKPKAQVFKQPLSECFTETNNPPDPIMKLMVLIYEKGPSINGIMRRGNNHALGKEIREKIESGQNLSLEDHQTPTVASVFKDFLRCIPGGLLTAKLEAQWMAIGQDDPADEKIMKIREILDQLPPQNHRLLTLTICLLQQIAKHKDDNKMSPSNLATCIAPSFFSDSKSKQLPGKMNADSLMEVQNSMMAIRNNVTPLITFMIIKHVEIFGEEILNAFVPFGCSPSTQTGTLEDELVKDQISNVVVGGGVGSGGGGSNNGMMGTGVEDEGDEEMFEEDRIRMRRKGVIQPMTRQSNSGTDSDSTHSVLSMADNGVMMRRDDSSIDSLVDRDYYPADSSPTVVKSHLSPSNLSRDSGLTLSDTQLYDEDGDMTMTGNKMYQRSASHDDELEPSDMGMYDPNLQRRQEPVPPPRSSRSSRKPRGFRSEGLHEPHSFGCGPTGNHHKPAPFLHSASTTALDFLPSSFSKSARPDIMGTSTTHHIPLSKRISSDSIGEEDESGVQLKPVDFQRIRKESDMGTIVKSDSGTHLFLKDDLQPSKYSLESGQRIITKDRYLRQSSIADSTPPVSPQSRYSQSSRDSFVSNSTYSMSQDSPGHSAPQTPDSLSDKPLSWSANHEQSHKTIDPRLTQSLNSYSHNLSKSTPNIAKDLEFIDDEDTDDDDTESSNGKNSYTDKWPEKYRPSTLFAHGRSRSHEAEEVESRHRPNFSLLIRNEDQDLSSSHAKSNSLPTTNDKHQILLKGSPPPNVLLKSLQGPTRRESVPARPNEVPSPHYRRSSADTVNHPPIIESSKSANTTPRIDEYGNAKSKPIMISPNSQEAQSSFSRAKLSKYVVSSVDLRPDKPPCYQQTLQRQFMLKQNVPVDIDMDDKQKQRENSYNARAMYEKSIRLYNEQRTPDSDTSQPSANMPISSESSASFSSPSSSDFVDAKRSKFKPVIIQSVNSTNSYSHSVDVSHSGGASKDLSGSPDTYDDSGASGFIDLGPISNNLQEDIVRRRNAHAGSGQSIGVKGPNASNPVSISRTDSKLSDTGSSSGSSVTLSTLSRHSDSFGRRSDISNVSNITVSSVTSDSSSENSVMSRRKSNSSLDNHNMSYSRHFRPVEPEDDESEEEVYEEEEHYVILRKDPQTVYQESIKQFEQRNLYPQAYPSTTAQPSLVSSSPSSSSSSTYSLTPRSSVDHSIEPKSNFQQSAPSSSSVPTTQRVSVGIKRSEPLPQFNRQDSQTKLPNGNKTNNSSGGNSYVEKTEPPRSEPPRKFSLTEMQSDEHHNNFLKVRSLFYNPDDDQASSPAPSPRFPITNKPQQQQQQQQHISTSTQNIPLHIPNEIPVSITESSQNVNTNNNSNNKNNNNDDVNSKFVNTKTNVPSPTIENQNKELPWNVKKLKKFFDTDSGHPVSGVSTHPDSFTSTSNRKISTGASAQRRSPPPYQNPPPFRRPQDNTRHSTSSNSSAGSEYVHSKSNTGPHRLGPQASAKDISFNSSYSSSEESYSSLDRRSRKSSLQDSDSPIDFSNITYV